MQRVRQETLDKVKDVKLFLFDLEGVLLFKNNLTEEKSRQTFMEQILKACKEFCKYNVRFGIVTAHKEDEFIDELRKIENCIILSTSVEKVSAVEELLNKLNLGFDKIFYMGDEVLDIPLLRKCGLSAAPKSSSREVKRVVDLLINSTSAEDVFKEIFNLFQKAGLNGSNGFKGNIPPPIN